MTTAQEKLDQAITDNNIDQLQEAINEGCVFDNEAKLGMSINRRNTLYKAIKSGVGKDFFAKLLDNGAKIIEQEYDYDYFHEHGVSKMRDGSDTLLLAIKEGQPDLVELIISKKGQQINDKQYRFIKDVIKDKTPAEKKESISTIIKHHLKILPEVPLELIESYVAQRILESTKDIGVSIAPIIDSVKEDIRKEVTGSDNDRSWKNIKEFAGRYYKHGAYAGLRPTNEEKSQKFYEYLVFYKMDEKEASLVVNKLFEIELSPNVTNPTGASLAERLKEGAAGPSTKNR